MSALTQMKVWFELIELQKEIFQKHLTDLFAEDQRRFEKFSLESGAIFLDYSRNFINQKAMNQLIRLAHERHLPQEIERLFQGEVVNHSENKPALHTALRNLHHHPIHVNGLDIMPEIAALKKKIANFVRAVREKRYLGFSQKPITDIIHVGVGGSDLGPVLVYEALKSTVKNKIHCHFISNPDKEVINEKLQSLNPETTLLIIVSKSFGTVETLINAKMIHRWYQKSTDNSEIIKVNLCAVTENKDRALQWGIPEQNIFPIWDWVGGRFSVWSAVGLSLAISLGIDVFEEFLAGAQSSDEHFRYQEFGKNIPVILALLDIWYINFFGIQTHAVIPYGARLKFLPEYLQQLHMESQGKSVLQTGEPIDYSTGAIIWGGMGVNSQHSFHQLFFQGNHLVPIDFVLSVEENFAEHEMELHLVANCLAQGKALMHGSQTDSTHKDILGNTPSNTFLLNRLTPLSLGSLLAFYEHKVFVQSVIWGINPFDQWGVEQGKKIAKTVLQDLEQGTLQPTHDDSSKGLIETIRRWSKQDISV